MAPAEILIGIRFPFTAMVFASASSMKDVYKRQIYVSVAEHDNNCIICVEDDGVGVSDEQIEKLNNTPHYMVCDSKMCIRDSAKCARLQVADRRKGNVKSIQMI